MKTKATSLKRKSDAAATPEEPKKTKTKTTKPTPKKNDRDDIPDISDIHLEDEETYSVPVFDTCDMVRSKIRAFLKKYHSETNTSLARRMGSTATNLRRFCEKKGYDKGNTSGAFYEAYVYFEKLRVAEGKPKSKDRLKMEELWSHRGGFDREKESSHKGINLGPSEAITKKNKFGEITVERRDGRGRPITGVI